MTTLDVALRVRLQNMLGAGANAARQDLQRLTDAAKKLNGASADKLARDLAKTTGAAKGAEAGLQKVAAGARKLEGSRADKLARDLARARGEATAGEHAVYRLGQSFRRLEGVRADRLAQDLKKVTGAAREAAGALEKVKMPALVGGHGKAGGGDGAILFPGLPLGPLAGAVSGYTAGRAVKRTFTDFAELDRRMTRLGNTAEATKDQTAAATAEVRAIAKEYGMPVESVLVGLEALVAQGNSMSESLIKVRSASLAAHASGAAVDDMANSVNALNKHLGITNELMPEALDISAKGGKLGQFELKDMAHYLPSMAPAAAPIVGKGLEGLRRLIAALQTVRAGTGDSAEAATALNNLLAKMESKETIKNFKDFGINLPKALAKARKEGKDLLEVFTDLAEKALKGDMSKITQLIGDWEFQKAVRALISQREEYRRFFAELANSQGTVARDAASVSSDAQASIDRLSNAWNAASVAVGKFTAESTPAIAALEYFSHILDLARGDPAAIQKEKQFIANRPFDAFVGRTRDERRRRERDEEIQKIEGGLSAGSYPTAKPGPNWPSEREWAEDRLAKLRAEREAEKVTEDRMSRISQLFGYQSGTGPGEAAQKSMEGVTSAIKSEGEKAVSAAQDYANRIKEMFDFTATPKISPRFGAPAGAASSDGAATPRPQSFRGGAPAAAPAREARAGRGSVVIHNVNVHGVTDLASLEREITRRTDREILDARDGALHDTGSFT
jgi:TP901 family phage tail tape measure protein